MEPTITVVLVTRDDARTLAPALTAFGELEGASDLEVVIVAPTTDAARPVSELAEPFRQVVPVGAGPIVSRGRAAAAGVRAASAPIVALSENHCFPVQGWTGRVRKAHAVDGRVGVGPAIVNANPDRARSRVAYAAGYGMYAPGEPAGPREQLPLHNSSFLRAAVAPLDDRLDALLADERRFWDALREAGGTLWFEPSCRKRHINESTWTLTVGIAWCGGRRYAGDRARGWPRLRRWAYALASPLITVPVYRNLWRLRAASVGASRRAVIPDALTTVVFACAHAAGEAASYLLGPVDAYPFVEDDEFMIRERLVGGTARDPEVERLLATLEADTDQSSKSYSSR